MSGGPRWARLTRRRYATDPVSLAQALIGCRLVCRTSAGKRVSGVIVETEAYLGVEDAAAHSYRGRRTARTEPMYGAPGTAYVYFTYGMHHCFNVVCGEPGEPVAVLIRALRPDEGVALMRRRRRSVARRSADATLCAGPGRLCQALGIDRRLTGVDLTSHPRLFIEGLRGAPDPTAVHALANTRRIGVGYAGDWARRSLRWHIEADPHVSRAPRSAPRASRRES